MIGVDKMFSGRLGNILFQYNILRQLSEKTSQQYYFPWFNGAECFEMNPPKRPFFSNFKKKKKYSSLNILTMGVSNFVHEIIENDINNIVSILEPPLLGELFLALPFYSPQKFIIIKPEYKSFRFDLAKKCIALHFRGGDFKAWDENALLDFGYYKNALELCFDEYGKANVSLFLFSDDLQLESYIKVLQFLSNKGITYISGNNSLSPAYDLYEMSQADVLISSPSTFAIWGGILGKKKRIIHSKEWMAYALKKNDKFWVDLNNDRSEYYRLWRTV